jgi:hypothetical protein
MWPALKRTYLELPSVKTFTKRIRDSLCDRNNTLVLLPRQIEEDYVWDELQNLIDHDGLSYVSIDVETAADQKPIDVLNILYPVEWETVHVLRNIASYLERAKLPDVILLIGIEKLPKSKKAEWLKFLVEWSQVSHQQKNQGQLPSALCVIVDAIDILDIIPKSDLCLTIHWWWTFPSILETKMLCRILALEDDQRKGLGEWREHLISSLSLGNLQLVEFLWDRVCNNPETIIDDLCRYASETVEEVANEVATQASFVEYGEKLKTTMPNARIQDHWANGHIVSTIENGIEICTLALARTGRVDEIRHRIWRAQVDLLLPQIDNVRLIVCKRLTQMKGSSWPYKWEIPTSEEQLVSVQENPLTTELGYLNHLLFQNNNFRDCGQWRRLVSITTRLRNEIAHYRAIAFSDYKEFLFEIENAL